MFRTAWLLLTFILLHPLAARSDQATALDVAKRLGLSEASIEKVRRGEVVVEELEPSSDKDLSLALVAAVDAPLEQVREFVQADRMAELSTVTLSHGEIDTKTFSLAAMKLPDAVLDRLVRDPAGTFFLSDAEASRIAEAGKQGRAQALEAYQSVLSARAKAYWEKGLAGIEPYAGAGRSPATDLGHADEAARKLVRSPAVLNALDTPPSKADSAAVHSLGWAIQKGRDQAAPVLIHRIRHEGKEGDIYIDRRFYSGYDYDALQVVTGVVSASEKRCAVFYTNHTFTAQVTGFGGGAKRSIGRKLMSGELVSEIQRAQKAVAAQP
ncbi:MAG: hypothetical protein R3E53_22910 [Myxococcota bacterium]